ncbi:hypothetical protein KQI84_02380 [bacterium]|nr:hypothetical protein [bacterium]
MSELRVAVVGEGPTDTVIIEAALKALLPDSFVITQIQPEPTRPKLGTGWGGVLRWCQEFATRGFNRIEDDPTLPGFDLFIIHLDADVAEYSYEDVSPGIAQQAMNNGWPPLPNSTNCPPATGGAGVVRALPIAWANLSGLGPKTVLCVPSKATEAWLVAALFSDGHRMLNDLECNLNLENRLKQLPLAEKVKKKKREYQAHEQRVRDQWGIVRQRCSQAERFSLDVLAALP